MGDASPDTHAMVPYPSSVTFEEFDVNAYQANLFLRMRTTLQDFSWFETLRSTMQNDIQFLKNMVKGRYGSERAPIDSITSSLNRLSEDENTLRDALYLQQGYFTQRFPGGLAQEHLERNLNIVIGSSYLAGLMPVSVAEPVKLSAIFSMNCAVIASPLMAVGDCNFDEKSDSDEEPPLREEQLETAYSFSGEAKSVTVDFDCLMIPSNPIPYILDESITSKERNKRARNWVNQNILFSSDFNLHNVFETLKLLINGFPTDEPSPIPGMGENLVNLYSQIESIMTSSENWHVSIRDITETLQAIQNLTAEEGMLSILIGQERVSAIFGSYLSK